MTQRVQTTTHTFQIATAVNLRLPTSQWSSFAPSGKANPKALYAMSEEEAYELVRDLEQRDDQLVRPSASIQVVDLTVTCFRVEQCAADGTWFDTGQRETSEATTDGGTVRVPVSTELDSRGLARFLCGDYDDDPATSRGEAAERGKLREALRPYMEQEEAYQSFSCD